MVGYGGVGFAQGPASLIRSYAVIGPSVWVALSHICCRICDYRDASSPSYPLICVLEMSGFELFGVMLWYGACLEVAIISDPFYIHLIYYKLCKSFLTL